MGDHTLDAVPGETSLLVRVQGIGCFRAVQGTLDPTQQPWSAYKNLSIW